MNVLYEQSLLDAWHLKVLDFQNPSADGKALLKSLGVEKEIKRKDWFNIYRYTLVFWDDVAVANGRKKAHRNRNSAESKLDEDELKKAQALSKRCLEKPANCPEYSD